MSLKRALEIQPHFVPQRGKWANRIKNNNLTSTIHFCLPKTFRGIQQLLNSEVIGVGLYWWCTLKSSGISLKHSLALGLLSLVR